MSNDLSQQVERLAKARQTYAEKKAALDKARAEWEALNKPLIDEVKLAKTEQDVALVAVQQSALDVFIETENKKPHPAIEIKMFGEPAFVSAEAREWALKHCPALLALDEKAYGKLYRAYTDSETLKAVFPLMPGVMEETAKPTIKTDLSAWLPVPVETSEKVQS